MSNSTVTSRLLRSLVVVVIALACTGVAVTASWAERSGRQGQQDPTSPRSKNDKDDDEASCHRTGGDEAPSLPRRGRTTWGHPPANGSPRGQQLHSFAVGLPATAFLRLDRYGRIVAAATNTGCPPRRLDEIFVYRADGSITSSTAVDVGRIRWQGDFSKAGVFQRQSPGLPICTSRRTQCE